MPKRAILLASCRDRPGIVAAIAGFLAERGGNILRAAQHQDTEHDLFLTRIEWDLDGFDLGGEPFSFASFARAFAPVSEAFAIDWTVALASERQRVAVFVSRDTHCLADLLYRQSTGDLACDIPVVIGNHASAGEVAATFNAPFVHIPVQHGHKEAAEEVALRVLDDHAIDLVVLARYMQILGPRVTDAYPRRIINIHHSFLPAFAGAQPYHQAYTRGVKLIGATAHYVTPDLDEGPIIEQDVTRISHADTVEDLVRKGRDLERVVLARAVRWHLDHRVIAYANRTVVFD